MSILMHCSIRLKVCKARRFRHRCLRPRSCPRGLQAMLPLASTRSSPRAKWHGPVSIPSANATAASLCFLADKLPLLAQHRPLFEPLSEREEKLIAALESTGASFSIRSIRRLAAAIPANQSMLCGALSGAASSRLIHFMPSALISPGPIVRGLRAVSKRVRRFDPAAPRRPPRKAAGRCFRLTRPPILAKRWVPQVPRTWGPRLHDFALAHAQPSSNPDRSQSRPRPSAP